MEENYSVRGHRQCDRLTRSNPLEPYGEPFVINDCTFYLLAHLIVLLVLVNMEFLSKYAEISTEKNKKRKNVLLNAIVEYILSIHLIVIMHFTRIIKI